MTFPIETKPCVIRPDEFQTIQNVYDSVTSEKWFTPSTRRREQFAAYMLDAYQHGLKDPFELKTLCRAAARERFCIH